MKKTLAILLVSVIATVAIGEGRTIYNKDVLFREQTIGAGSNSVSRAVDLNTMKPVGWFSLQTVMTGAGTVEKVRYEVSNDNVNFYNPVNAVNITTNLTTNITSGVCVSEFSPVFSRYLRIRYYVTNDSAIITGTLAIQ